MQASSNYACIQISTFKITNIMLFCSKQFACKVFVMLGKLKALKCATCIRDKIYNVALKWPVNSKETNFDIITKGSLWSQNAQLYEYNLFLLNTKGFVCYPILAVNSKRRKNNERIAWVINDYNVWENVSAIRGTKNILKSLY